VPGGGVPAGPTLGEADLLGGVPRDVDPLRGEENSCCCAEDSLRGVAPLGGEGTLGGVATFGGEVIFGVGDIRGGVDSLDGLVILGGDGALGGVATFGGEYVLGEPSVWGDRKPVGVAADGNGTVCFSA